MLPEEVVQAAIDLKAKVCCRFIGANFAGSSCMG
jgi:hypothetical protein